jgi:GntR family transcriptional regulator
LSLGRAGSVNPRAWRGTPLGSRDRSPDSPATLWQKAYTLRAGAQMTITPKSGAGVSRYLRLYQVLSQALSEGRFAGGGALPSEPQLTRDYGVSRSTVRRALARLEAEGRIERKRGSGTFPRDAGAASASRHPLPVLEATAIPPAATYRTVACQRIPTPPLLLGEGSGFGAATLLIRRVRYVHHEPLVLEAAYLPDEIGDGLTRRRLDRDGEAILTVLAAGGHVSASLEREFSALEADPLAANGLGLAVGAPVFSVTTLARDARQRTFAYLNCLYRPDRYEARAVIEIGAKQHRLRAGAELA